MITTWTTLPKRSVLLLQIGLFVLILTISSSASAALLAAASTPTSVSLSWTAPGDDSTTGRAAVYDVRYSLSTITDANWASATQVTGEPTPSAAGTGENFEVTGLIPGTTYYLAIKVSDDAGNWSGLSNIVAKATLPENTPPASITTLAATASTQTSVTLGWTAPGDDGSTGTATSYDVRYSTSTITDANWASASQASGEPSPKVAGGSETFTVTGLSVGTTYYFAVKTSDEIPNTSGLSNVVSRATSVESTPPSAIANLGAASETSTSVTLSWTAPGDDGGTGTATTYDIRYSTSNITSGNFNSATQVSGAPSPKVAGSAETFVVTGLNSSTTYYFAVKTADDVPNWSTISNVVSRATLVESTPPAAIANLTASASGQNSVTLTWTAPGDDGSTGTATSYDVRYSLSNITEANWASATQVTGESAPKIAGSSETITVTGLSENTTYYFAIKSSDEVPNTSAISNIASRSTSGDITPPASIKDLSAVPGSNNGELVLNWTAPGDDSTTGFAVLYVIRYSTTPMTVASWESSSMYTNPPIPKVAGSPETVTMRGLIPGQRYYVGIKTLDERANASAVSNIADGSAKAIIVTSNDQETPLLVAPAPGATVVSAHPVLAAENVTIVPVSTYYFEVATDSNFFGLTATGVVPSSENGTTTWRVSTPLETGQTYYWRARGDALAYSPVSTFSVNAATHAYPNPFVMTEAPQATFADLPSGSDLVLMTISGEAVRTWTNVGGSDVQWDGTNERGGKVASGVYLWYVPNSDAKGKLVVVR